MGPVKRHSSQEQLPDSPPKQQKQLSLFETIFSFQHVPELFETVLRSEFYRTLATCSTHLAEIAAARHVRLLNYHSAPFWMKFGSLDSFTLCVNRVGPQITALNLTDFNEQINDESLEDILGTCSNPDFNYLSLAQANITDQSVFLLARRYPKLKTIKLIECSLITDMSLITLGGLCKSLTSVNLWNGRVENHDVSSTGIIALAMGIHSLQSLKVNTHTEEKVIDNACLALYMQRESLRVLHLDSCEDITHEGYIFLSRLTKLTQLTLHDCTGLGDKTFKKMLPPLTKLTHLRLWDSSISLESIERIITYLPALESLEILGDEPTQIPMSSQDMILRGLPNLTKLDITWKIE